MSRFYKIILIILILFQNTRAIAQDSTEKKKSLTINGYIKNLQTLNFTGNFSDLIAGNLLHNRLNLKWKASSTITTVAEFRQRLFWGEQLKNNPGLYHTLRNENEWINLSKTWINSKNLLLHTNTERLWAEYRKEKWNIRIGRQRINWGMATTWNPNDLFNTYNFLDFDYEERAGSDAIKLQYLFTDFSNLEIAVSSSGKKDRSIIMGKYFLNKGGYDLQLITGIYQGRFSSGLGWAGNIGEAGFRGEAQLFFPQKDSGTVFNYTLETDYVFKNGWYISGGMLYNSKGIKNKIDDWTKVEFSPSPEKLMPTQWNFLLTASREITPLLSLRLATVYSPNADLLILLPSLGYNLALNFTTDLIWQSFFADMGGSFGAINHLCSLRMRWSF